MSFCHLQMFMFRREFDGKETITEIWGEQAKVSDIQQEKLENGNQLAQPVRILFNRKL